MNARMMKAAVLVGVVLVPAAFFAVRGTGQRAQQGQAEKATVHRSPL